MKKSEIISLECGYCEQLEIFISKSGKLKFKKFPANVFLIPIKNGILLFDSGYCGDLNNYKNNFLLNLYTKILPVHTNKNTSCFEQLNKMNIDIDEVKYIFISHFHPDHIGGLKDFKNCKFICSKEEYYALKGIRKNFAEMFLPNDFEDRVLFIENFEKNTVFPDFTSYLIEKNLWAVYLPGHTKYQYGLYSKDFNTFLIADSVWTDMAYKNFELPHLGTMNIMEDKKQYIETIKKIKNLFHSTDIKILYSHQEFN